MQGFNQTRYQQSVGVPGPFTAHGRVGQFGPFQSPGWPQQSNPFRFGAMPQQMPQQAPVGGLAQMYAANISSPALGGISPNMGQPVQQPPAGALALLQNELLAQKTALPIQPQSGVASMPQQTVYSPMPMAQSVAQSAAPLPQQTVPGLLR